jgi:hypothetical protein
MKTLWLAAVTVLTAAAQTPPPILRIVRNPAPNDDHPYARANAPIEVLGVHSSTGARETWFIEQHPTFVSIEDLDKAMASAPAGDPSHWLDPRGAPTDEVLGPGRILIAFYREGWGYHPEDAVRMLPRARYFNITVYRMRPDSDSDMDALMRARHSRLDSMNMNQPDLVYHVISGGSSGLYLVLAPLVSLRTMDERVSRAVLEVESKQPAVSEFGRETLLFRIDPALSYVSDDFASADKAFWRGQ